MEDSILECRDTMEDMIILEVIMEAIMEVISEVIMQVISEDMEGSD